METQTMWERIREIAGNPLEQVRQWKQRHHGAVIGCMSCLPYFVPEEVIHAAGALPVGIWGAEIPISQADARLQSFTCTMARSSLEMGLRGMLSACDAVVFPSTCDAFQNLSEIWKRSSINPATVVNVVMPRHTDRVSAFHYARQSLRGFLKRIEQLTATEISAEALSRSIEIYETNRSLLREADKIRRSAPELISAADMMQLVLASTFMPKQEHTALARGIVEAARARPATTGLGGSPGVRIFLAGVMPRPVELLRVLERAGVQVVGDRLGMGSLYYDLAIPTEGDPLEALARGYMSYPPCSTIHTQRSSRAHDLIDRVRESRAHGVIILGMKFCEPEFFDYPDLEARLEEAGIPSLLIETELGMGDVGQAQTRLEAFLETLQAAPEEARR